MCKVWKRLCNNIQKKRRALQNMREDRQKEVEGTYRRRKECSRKQRVFCKPKETDDRDGVQLRARGTHGLRGLKTPHEIENYRSGITHKTKVKTSTEWLESDVTMVELESVSIANHQKAIYSKSFFQGRNYSAPIHHYEPSLAIESAYKN